MPSLMPYLRRAALPCCLAVAASACTTVRPSSGDAAARPGASTISRTSPGAVEMVAATRAANAAVARGDESVQVRDDTPPPAAPRDLWQRIRAGFAMPAMTSPLVDDKIRYYTDRPDYLQRMFSRGSRYLFHIVNEIEKRGMPTELALLPFVESAMNPGALSSAKAAGLWQFIPSTGRQYSLSQNWWVDNRRDVEASTRAALDYLQRIYKLQGNDWFLALASYNWGEGAVQRAVRRNEARGLPTDYLSLSMPAETRQYVPKLLALREIVLRSTELGVTLPEMPDKPYFATVERTRPMDLKLAAQFAGMSVDEFVALNPAHNRPVIAATHNNVIRIPADRIDQFRQAVREHEEQAKVFATWQPYTLKAGESLDDVARRGGVTVAELRKANSIATQTRVLPGTRLLAPMANVVDESGVDDFSGARVYQLVTVPAATHVVRRRETVASIARRHGLTPSQLAAMNGGVRRVVPGVRLVVRQAYNQTVVTNEHGGHQVVGRSAAERPARLMPAANVQPASGRNETGRGESGRGEAGRGEADRTGKAASGGRNRDPARGRHHRESDRPSMRETKSRSSSTRGASTRDVSGRESSGRSHAARGSHGTAAAARSDDRTNTSKTRTAARVDRHDGARIAPRAGDRQ